MLSIEQVKRGLEIAAIQAEEGGYIDSIERILIEELKHIQDYKDLHHLLNPKHHEAEIPKAAPAPKEKKSDTCPGAEDLVKEAEGFRSCKYHNTLGVASICYNLNLQTPTAESAIKAVGANFAMVMAGT